MPQNVSHDRFKERVEAASKAASTKGSGSAGGKLKAVNYTPGTREIYAKKKWGSSQKGSTMPETVEAAVEKLLSGQSGKPAAPAEAPAGQTDPKAGERSPEAPSRSAREQQGDSTPSEESLSSFEEELLQEGQIQDQYDALDPAARKPFLAALKTFYRNQSRSMADYGKLKRAFTTLREAGVTEEDLTQLLQSKQGGSGRSPTTGNPGTNGSTRGLAKLLEQAKTAEEREQIHGIRQAIREEMEDLSREHLDRELRPVRERMERSEQEAQTHRETSLAREIDALEDEQGFSGSLVETYRDSMLTLGKKFPRLTAKQLLYKLADPDELEEGRRPPESPSKERSEPARPKASITKAPETSKTLPRDKHGVISVSKAVDFFMRPKR